MKFNTRIFRNFFLGILALGRWQMNIRIMWWLWKSSFAKIAECRKVMIALYETIIWNILGGEKEKWILHDEPKLVLKKKELIFSLENGEAFERKWTNDDDLFLFYCVCLSICKEQRTFASIVSMFMSIFNPYVSTMLCHWKPLKSIKWRSSNNLLFELLFAFVAT